MAACWFSCHASRLSGEPAIVSTMPESLRGVLDKRRTMAGPGFNRWLVPPAARCVHLCIGMAYGFSVFWLPLTRAVGITQPVPCPPSLGLLGRLTTTYDRDKPLLGWMDTLFLVLLGSSAALFGTRLERAGPRKAAIVSALCWCGGLDIAAAAVYWHQLWGLWLGSGWDTLRRCRYSSNGSPIAAAWRREWPSWDWAAVLFEG